MERHQSVATETVPPARLITDTGTADGTTAMATSTDVNAVATAAQAANAQEIKTTKPPQNKVVLSVL